MRELNYLLKNQDIKNSKILDEGKREKLMKCCDISAEKKLNLIYRASEHGFSAKDFHAMCDNVR